jgi:pimeloyl-ACP methyl ester carboxylesterase
MPTLPVHDLDMHYIERGEGPTMLALHAATANGTMMGWLAHSFVQDGFNVVSPDLRGHGETTNPAPDLHLPRLVGDVLEFAYQLGRTPVHGVGYSLGGALLLYAALRQPDLFRSLIILGSSYRAPSPERLLKAVGPVEEREADVRRVFDPETGTVVGWDKPVEAFAEVPLPTLIISADRDEFSDLSDSFALYNVMPNADLLVVPHTDHLGLVRHPLVYQGLRDFCARIPH